MPVNIIVLMLILLLVFGGWGGWRYGGPDYGPHYAGGGIGLVLLVILLLYLFGALGPMPHIR
jgi:hypothetical protein